MNTKAKRKSKKKCLTCDRPAITRGLCSSCRTAAQRAINRGDATEKQLIESGLMLATTKTGRPPENPFIRAMRKRAI